MSPKLRLLLKVVVGVAALAQLFLLSGGYLKGAMRDLWATRDLPAWERVALWQGGEDFAGYISFLRDHIPEGARVIIPPWQTRIPFGHVGFMQYLLYPRDIHNCAIDEVDTCILRVTGVHTFILGLPWFPPRELAERSKRFILYRDDYGVFAPK